MERPISEDPTRVTYHSKRPVWPHERLLVQLYATAACGLLCISVSSSTGCASAVPADGPSQTRTQTQASTPLGAAAAPAAEALPEQSERPEQSWSRLVRAGRGHLSRGELAEAEDRFTRAYDQTTAFRPGDPRTQTSIRRLERLSRAYLETGDGTSFARVMELLIYISETNPSSRRPEMATLMQELAAIRTLQGHHTEARDALERALTMIRELRGSDDASLVGLYAQLGLTLLELDDLEGAERAIDRAAEIAVAARGTDSVLFAKTLIPRAKLELERGDLENAREALVAAVDIHEEHYGENHPATAGIVRELALFEQNAGDTAAAERNFDRVINIWDAIPREQYQHAQSRNELAWFLVETGNPKLAEAPARSALGILEERGIGGQPLSAVADTLATALRDQQKYAEAEELYQQALSEGSKASGLPGWDVSAIAERYAILLEQTDRSQQAEELRARWRD